jgi:hypothetical protein
MTPSHAITSASEDVGRALLQRVSHLRDEADEIAEQWEGLGRAGGQRDDHAAALLLRLEPHLRDLATFADRCRQQILDMHADPFGRNDAA